MTVKDPIANVGVTTVITLQELHAGDRVSVVGPVTSAAGGSQPSSVTATVAKAAAKAKKSKKVWERSAGGQGILLHTWQTKAAARRSPLGLRRYPHPRRLLRLNHRRRISLPAYTPPISG